MASFSDLDGLYRLVAGHPGPIRDHLPALRRLAANAGEVIELADPLGFSTVALLAGQPRRLRSYAANRPKVLPYLERWPGATDFRFSVDTAAAGPADLLFVDTAAGLKRLEQIAPRVRRWVVIHARERIRLDGWHVVHRRRNGGGLLILSRDPADKAIMPELLKPSRDILAERLRHGPGGELKRLLARFWIEAQEGCGCGRHAARMDWRGSDWCEANRETIVDWLAKEAEKRPVVGRLFTRFGARRFVSLAIRRSRQYYGGLPAIERRNLIFHCYPSRENDIWRDNVAQLRRRWPVFNGRRIVAVAIGDGTHDAAEVAREFGEPVEIVETANDPVLRETATLPGLLDAIHNAAPNEATFYCHTKANATAESAEGEMPLDVRISGAIRWRNAMYHHLLDRADGCTALLESYLAVGTTQMICPEESTFVFPSGHPLRTWMFAGTFFWFRHDAVFSHPKWHAIPVDRYGAESWLGGLFRPADVCSVLQPWPADVFPANSPYHPNYYSEEFDDA